MRRLSTDRGSGAAEQATVPSIRPMRVTVTAEVVATITATAAVAPTASERVDIGEDSIGDDH
ncbi:MAG: hypothetical protein ACE5F9_06515 [Phycisphaerae bacterium]